VNLRIKSTTDVLLAKLRDDHARLSLSLVPVDGIEAVRRAIAMTLSNHLRPFYWFYERSCQNRERFAVAFRLQRNLRAKKFKRRLETILRR